MCFYYCVLISCVCTYVAAFCAMQTNKMFHVCVVCLCVNVESKKKSDLRLKGVKIDNARCEQVLYRKQMIT